MTRFKVKFKATRPLKLEILQFSKSISSAIFNVSWQMTTDSETTEQYLTFVRIRFLISVLVFVSREFELGRVSVQFANAFAIAITFARWRRRSQEATAVPYGANFYQVLCPSLPLSLLPSPIPFQSLVCCSFVHRYSGSPFFYI